MYILVLLHLLSDWILQPRIIAINKSTNDRILGIHVLIIFLVFATYCLTFGLPIYLALINAVLHGIIDRSIWRGYKKIRYSKDTHVKVYSDDWFWKTIGIDQTLHYIILIYLFT